MDADELQIRCCGEVQLGDPAVGIRFRVCETAEGGRGHSERSEGKEDSDSAQACRLLTHAAAEHVDQQN